MSNNDTQEQKPTEDGKGKQTQQKFYRPKFKGANELLATLCTKSERKAKDQFVVFQKSIEQYVMTDFTNPA